MLTDLQRLDYAEAMMKMAPADREAYLNEKQVTEATDIDVINQLVVELADNQLAESTIDQAIETAQAEQAEIVCDTTPEVESTAQA